MIKKFKTMLLMLILLSMLNSFSHADNSLNNVEKNAFYGNDWGILLEQNIEQTNNQPLSFQQNATVVNSTDSQKITIKNLSVLPFRSFEKDG